MTEAEKIALLTPQGFEWYKEQATNAPPGTVPLEILQAITLRMNAKRAGPLDIQVRKDLVEHSSPPWALIIGVGAVAAVLLLSNK